MKLYSRLATGRILAAAINGLVSGTAIALALYASKAYGWSPRWTVVFFICVTQAALFPVTRRINRKYVNPPPAM